MADGAVDPQLIGQALAQLSAEDSAVVRRSYYDAWTTAQIADRLQVADDTVKSRLHYAVRSLQRTLQEMGVAC